MFIYSVRASTLKFAAFLILTAVFLLGITAFAGEELTPTASINGSVDYSGVSTNEERVAFIERFGIKVEQTPKEERSFPIPENFDRVILGYNELQKKQGLDLSRYVKKRVTRYTYRVTNHMSEGEVYANLFIYRGRVVAADISSLDPEGFVEPLTLADKTRLK